FIEIPSPGAFDKSADGQRPRIRLKRIDKSPVRLEARELVEIRMSRGFARHRFRPPIFESLVALPRKLLKERATRGRRPASCDDLVIAASKPPPGDPGRGPHGGEPRRA